MGLKTPGAVYALKGGLLNRALYIGVGTGDSTEYAENTGGTYARIAVSGLSAWTRNDTGIAQNTAAMNFSDPSSDYSASPTDMFLWDKPFETTDDSDDTNNPVLLWQADLTGNPGTPVLGSRFGFNASALRLSLVGGAVTAMGSKAAFEAGLVSGTRYLSLHSADPGTDGSNRQGGFVEVADTVWTAVADETNKVQNNAVISWGVQTTDLPDLMWVALRDGNTDAAQVLWKDAFDNDPDDPRIGATISFPISMITIGFTVDA